MRYSDYEDFKDYYIKNNLTPETALEHLKKELERLEEKTK